MIFDFFYKLAVFDEQIGYLIINQGKTLALRSVGMTFFFDVVVVRALNSSIVKSYKGSSAGGSSG